LANSNKVTKPKRPTRPKRLVGESMKAYLIRTRPFQKPGHSTARARKRIGAAFERPIKTGEDAEIARLKGAEFRTRWSIGG
jgi:hypothetical protein